MKQTEKEIFILKEKVKLMWKLVISQVENAQKALLNNDRELASAIVRTEADVNTIELKIDAYCENFIALYGPVAIDLRLALSLIKISGELERIGDFAEGIARFVLKKECDNMPPKLLEELKIERMFEVLKGMLLDGFVAFETEQTKASERIISRDDKVDEIYHNMFKIVGEYIKNYPEAGLCLLKTVMLVRKLERMGDHNNNIIEEIVFFVEAKVLKHAGKTEE